MRVGVIGPLTPDSFADNILHCLPEIGATAVALGPIGPSLSNKAASRASQAFRGLSAETEQFAQKALLRRARDSDCDIIINVQVQAAASTVAELKESGAKVCLWYPDHLSNVGRLSMIDSEYDALFLKDPLFAARLRATYGLQAHYLPEACNPTWHKPVGLAGSEMHIAVVGNVYPTRMRLLRRLHDSGIPLRMYGAGFPRWSDPGPLRALHSGRPVTREDKSKVFREARGVLNNLHPAEMQSVNCRLFEATAAGGAVLCEYRSALPDLFNIGEEVLAFESYGELLAHCEMLLADDAMTERIGDAGSDKALGHHTYALRLQQLMQIVVTG
jgi:spore maturation protein CgeB